LGPTTWFGSHPKLATLTTLAEQYIYTFYWAIVTVRARACLWLCACVELAAVSNCPLLLCPEHPNQTRSHLPSLNNTQTKKNQSQFATLGYGDLTPFNTTEVVFTIVYVTINIVTWAYILGTITLLVTRQDEEIGQYRDRMQVLVSYCAANNLPRELKANMQGLLRLHMSLQGEATSDEAVLAVFPTSVRRRILRQLYAEPLSSCYLFQGVGRKFLDAVMTTARVELFLPRVEVVAALDHVNELYVIVSGAHARARFRQGCLVGRERRSRVLVLVLKVCKTRYAFTPPNNPKQITQHP
jgi:hypothetical protein